MANILVEFINYPQEREIIGRLLIAYGELEWALAACVRESTGSTMSESIRVLFRVRGESARIEVADAIARPAYIKIDLGGQWGNAIGAARICKNIRNQYAHCHWRKLPDGALRFINLDADATSEAGTVLEAEAIRIELELLQRQEDFFKYALDWLYYLQEEYKKRAGRSTSHYLQAPKSIPAPPLYNRSKTASPNSPEPSGDSS
jgi:hypothetical protein